MLARIALLAMLLISTAFTYPEKPMGGVNDYAQVLNAEQRARLDARLVRFFQRSGNQSMIAIFPSLEGESIEVVATELFKRWGIGTKKENNGLLLVVSVKDRALRIETGYGLEGQLPDALAGRIIRNDIVPFFREGQYFTGLIAYQSRVDQIFGVAEAGEAQPVVTRAASKPRSALADFGAILFLIFIIWLIGTPRRRHRSLTGRGRFNTPWIDAGLGGLGGWTVGRGSRHSRGGGGINLGDFFGGGGGMSGGGGASGRW